MEPSQEFCLSGCTCSFSLGPGFVVEEKAKKVGRNSKKNKQTNKQRQQLQIQQNPWTGVWERVAEKKNSRPLVISATSFADFFFAFSLLRQEPGPTPINL